MKTFAVVCNFILLAFASLAVFTSKSVDENLYLNFALLLSPFVNIIIISGSRINIEWLKSVVSGVPNRGQFKSGISGYNIFRFFAVSINLLLIGLAWWRIQHDIQGFRGIGFIIKAIIAFILLTPFISALLISVSRWDSFAHLRKTVTRTFLMLSAVFIVFFFAMRIWIGNGIKENIRIAQLEHPGKADDALLEYLADTTKSPMDRTNIAIWTLGQIRSRKALPVLKSLYRNDPEGHICRGHHNSELCQYELHKAIVSIESDWLGAKEKNIFGSWERLNR